MGGKAADLTAMVIWYKKVDICWQYRILLNLQYGGFCTTLKTL
jgi:hypothetical protein